MSGQPSNSANGAMLSPEPSWIEVYGDGSGGFVDLLKPSPGALRLADIARGMAYTCRYGGHINRFYSVAEHAVLVHDLLDSQGADPAACIGGLFHDAAEAYLGDVVAPLKWAMRRQSIDDDAHYMGGWPPNVAGHRSAYDRLSGRMDNAISEAFGIPRAEFDTAQLRTADMWALRIEARKLTASGGAHWRWPGELPNAGEMPADVTWFAGLTPDAARGLWLDRARVHGFYAEEVADVA